MSITDSFSDSGEEIIHPGDVVRFDPDFPKKVVVTFQERTMERMLSLPETREIASSHAGRRVPIYKTRWDGQDVAFYHTLLGGASSAGLLEEVIARGARQILFFGSCGVLDKSICPGSCVVPTAAYRDEGVSYHYAPPSDYIQIPTAEKLAALLEELHVPYVLGRTWTTDGFYRETRENMLRRRLEGCVVVEMECASIMSVGQFRGVEVYQFLYAEDSLDELSWDKRIMGKLPDALRHKHMELAFQLTVKL